MIINRRKMKLMEKLRDKEYREAFVEESINVGIPFQIKALREQRTLTQKELEIYSGMKQTLISRLENPDYEGFSISTLKRIASIFDIGLIVRFAPISDLVKWELNLNSESLKALSYEDDPYFKETEESTTLEPEQRVLIHESSTSGNVVYISDYTSQSNEVTTDEKKILTANIV